LPLFNFLRTTLPAPPQSTLFPYTTLFRSSQASISSCQPTMDRASKWMAKRRPRRCRRLPSSAVGTAGERHPIPAFNPLGVGCSRSEEHTSELQSQSNLVCRLLLEKKNLPH